MTLSKKQCQAIKEATHRICIWQGAVRSGKTFSSILKFIDLLRNGPPGDVLIVGYTRDAIQRNVLTELCSLLGASIPPSKNTELRMLGRTVYLIGASDERAVSRIQGSTLAIAYVDEGTRIPPPFFRMLLSRLSVPKAQLLVTCNPEGPAHWLKKDFIDRADELDLVTWQFQLDDNPSLEEKYKNDLKSEYTGHWYARYILGEWAVASGLVYDTFDDDNIYDGDLVDPHTYIAGIDYGTINPTACVLVGLSNQWPKIRVEEEYYYASRDAGRQKTDSELAQDIKRFIGWRRLEALYVDPSAASLKLELQRLDLPVCDAVNDVISGIKTVHNMLGNKSLVINRKCTHLIEELQSYSWDEKAADRGVDKILKNEDHVCFIKDTMVLTIVGEKPIQNIKCGELVLTSKGYKKVISTMCNESSDIWKLEYNGRFLIGTGDHPVITSNGKVPIKSMNGLHCVCTIQGDPSCQENLNSLNSTELNTDVTHIQKEFQIENIIGVMQKILEKVLDIFTETFGNIITAQSRQGFTYTTLMETPVTTSLTISCASHVKTIIKSINQLDRLKKKKNVKAKLVNLLSLKKERPIGGINLHASNVKMNIDQSKLQTANSAVQNVEPQTEGKVESMMKTESVQFAATRLDATSMRRLNAAQNVDMLGMVEKRQKIKYRSVKSATRNLYLSTKGGSVFKSFAALRVLLKRKVWNIKESEETNQKYVRGVTRNSMLIGIFANSARKSADQLKEKFIKKHAISARVHLNQELREYDSAAEHVQVKVTKKKEKRAKEKLSVTASCVEQSSQQISSQKYSAHQSAKEKRHSKEKESIKVYNITVEDQHEYFANGLLVKNCDALRYCLYSHMPDGEVTDYADYSIDKIKHRIYGENQSFGDMMGFGGHMNI